MICQEKPQDTANRYIACAIRALRLLWRERCFFVRLVALGTLVGLILAIMIPARYTATVQLMPPDSIDQGNIAALASGVADKAGGLGTAAADLLGFKSSGAIFVGILKSRTLQDSLVNQFDLRRVYRVRYLVKAREELRAHTNITEDRKSGLIQIQVSDRDPARAQQIAQAYVDQLNSIVSHSAMSAASRERQFIEQQMIQAKREVDESARALANFSKTNGAIDLKEQARAMVDGVATVQGQLIAARSDLKGLQAIYSDSNVHVKAVQARIGELNRQLNELGGEAVAKGASSGSVAGYPSLRNLPDLGVTYQDIYQRNKISEAVYESLLEQYEASKIEEAKDTPKVQVLDAPDRPEMKSFPPRALIVIGCFCLSVIFAYTWIIVGDGWSKLDREQPVKKLASEVRAVWRLFRHYCVFVVIGRRFSRIG